MLEKTIEKYLVSEVKQRGGITRKAHFIAHRGAPDRIVMFPEVLIWVELKAPGGKLTALQEIEHATLKAFGQLVYVCDSKESVDEVIKKLIRHKA